MSRQRAGSSTDRAHARQTDAACLAVPDKIPDRNPPLSSVYEPPLARINVTTECRRCLLATNSAGRHSQAAALDRSGPIPETHWPAKQCRCCLVAVSNVCGNPKERYFTIAWGGSNFDYRRGSNLRYYYQHDGYQISLRKRKRIEEVFGWVKSSGCLQQVKVRGIPYVHGLFRFALSAYNLLRIRNLSIVPT